jgi:uncharacterized protein YjbJ (UPF0337 family)
MEENKSSIDTEKKPTSPPWIELKAKIKTRWNKFSDQDLESVKDKMDAISGQVQKVYGMSKEQADREFQEFKTSLKPQTPLTPPTPIGSASIPRPQRSADTMVSEGGGVIY